LVIGSGQLAKIFQDSMIDSSVCIFASGVSNSNCINPENFRREETLLMETLQNNGDKKFIYFSSCALSADNYPKNNYYMHKSHMENIIKEYSNNYYILRMPQLFGDLILHKTLINFLYKSIIHHHQFNIYDNAWRYVIEINDLKTMAEAYLQYSESCVTVDLANPYRYKVLEIVRILEDLMGEKALYTLVKKDDHYLLDLSSMQNFIVKNHIDVTFGKDYLHTKLSEKIK